MELTPQERAHLDFLMVSLLKNPMVHEMKKYIQHGTITTYDHCLRVTEMSYMLNNRFHLGADEKILVTGAFLHDFYLYDWHENDSSHRLHGFFHPGKACINAKKYFDVDKRELDIIRNHMWPLTITRIPNSREAWTVCLVDKLCSIRETLLERKRT